MPKMTKGFNGSIWLSKPEDEPYGLAILALDQHRASNRDLLVYWLLEATFRSMSADRATATEEIDDLFPRIIGFTKECVPDALAQVIKKMFQCYFHISGGRGASEIATRLHKMAPQLSVEEIQRPCWYPEPDDWAYEDAQQFQMFTPHGQVISITNAELRRLCELYRP